MRKRRLPAAILLVASLCLGTLGFGAFRETKKVYAENWQPVVKGGVLDERVPFGHNGGSNGDAAIFGSELIEVPEAGENRGWYELQLAGGWGSRYTFDYGIDVRDAGITLDLSHVNNDGYVGLILGAGKGNYFNAEYGGFGIKIHVHNDQYGIVISNVIHRTTIESIVPAPAPLPWDSGNTGYVVTAEDGIVELSFRQTSDDTVTIAANGNAYSVPTEEFTKVLGDDISDIYLMAGSFGDTKEIVRMTLTDAKTKAYEKELPGYVQTVVAYETAAEDLTDAQKILAAEKAGRAVAVSGMRNYDLAYYKARLTAAADKIAAAREKLPAGEKITVFANDVKELNGMISSAKSNEDIALADKTAEEIAEKDVAEIEKVLTEDLKAKFGETKTGYEQALASLEEARKKVVLGYLAVYEEKIGKVSSAADVFALGECRDAINENLKKLSSADKSEIGLKLVEHAETLAKLTSLEGWTTSDGSVIYTDGSSVELLGKTAFNDLSETRNGSTLTYSEKVKANRFSTEIAITAQSMKLFENWIGISITRNADNFYYATDAANEEIVGRLQSNPGIAITLEKRAGNKLYAEVFMIKTTNTSIYSASRGQMLIDYREGDPLKIRIEAADDENATYSRIYFNDVSFSGTPIKNSEIKVALGGYEGYLSFSFANPGSSIRVDKINGAKAADPSGSDPGEPDSSEPISGSQTSETPDGGSSGKKSCRSALSGEMIPALLALAFFFPALAGKRRENR